MQSTTYGPAEARILWVEDQEAPDPGDCDDAAFWQSVQDFGVFGCVVETRAPTCACCGVKQWEHAASLWGIIGDADYHCEIERELLTEV